MKTLYLVRHAKSSWDNPNLDDFDRPLNERGLKDAPRMGKRLKDQGATPSLIYSSPAVRAITTAEIIAKVLGYPINSIRSEQKLYHGDEDTILGLLKHIPEKNDIVMLTGHNPGLSDFANNLLDKSIDVIPTTGVVAIEMEINSWKEVKWECGRLIFFDSPKNK